MDFLRRCLALLLCGCLHVGGINSANAEWSVRVWGSPILQDLSIQGLAQTDDGFLWTATRRSLLRFNGGEFTEFEASSFGASTSDRIQVLIGSSRGGLWIALDKGRVVRVEKGRAATVNLPSPSLSTEQLFEDAEGAVWVVCRGGLLFRLKQGQCTPIPAGDGFTPGGGVVVSQDRSGKMWYFQKGSVGIIRDGQVKKILQLDDLTTRFAPSRDGSMWIGSGPDLYRYRDDRPLEKVGRIYDDDELARPSIMMEDRQGTLWIGTVMHGLVNRSGSKTEKIPTSFRRINQLLEDAEGTIWVGTSGGGLNCVRPKVISVEGSVTSLPYQSVQAVCEDPEGRLWGVTHEGKLVSRVGASWTVVPNTNRSLGRPICLAADATGALWLGTRTNRLQRWTPEGVANWGAAEGLVSHVINAIFVASNGDVWCGGSNPNSVQCFRKGKLVTYALPRQALGVSVIAQDLRGVIWMGTRNGSLLRVDADELVELREFSPQGATTTPAAVQSIVATPDGNLWIAYSGAGLARIRDGGYFSYRPAQGLRDDMLSFAITDGRGWLWMADTKGVLKVRLAELNDVAEGRGHRVQPVTYGVAEGMPRLFAPQGEPASALLSRSGKLWIPLGTSLVVISPENATAQLPSVPLVISQLQVDDRVSALYRGTLSANPLATMLPLSGPHRVPPSDAHHKLEFSFDGLSFASPENVHYRYRLRGFDEDWIDAGTQRTATYPSVPTGRYRFEVKACNSLGVWLEQASSLELEIPPPFWDRWWFKGVLLTLFTAGVAALVHRVALSRLKVQMDTLKSQAALERERTRIARDIHDDLGNGLTRILLLSDLAKRNITEPDKSLEYLRKISDSTVEVTTALDEIVWAVNPRNDTTEHLINYLAKHAMEFLRTAGIDCDIDLPESLPLVPLQADLRHSLFLVTKEALNNIARHSGASLVRFRIVVGSARLEITIEDNGRGFSGEAPAPGSDGLLNMKARMQEIGGSCTVASAPGKGTRLQFECPLKEAACRSSPRPPSSPKP